MRSGKAWYDVAWMIRESKLLSTPYDLEVPTTQYLPTYLPVCTFAISPFVRKREQNPDYCTISLGIHAK